MPKYDPECTRLAARLLAAWLQEGGREVIRLIDDFSPENVQRATDGLVSLSYICAGSIGENVGKTFGQVLCDVPVVRSGFLAEVSEDWPEMIRIINCFGQEQPIVARDIDIPTALATSFSIALALLRQSVDLSGQDAEYLAVRLSEFSDPQILASHLGRSSDNTDSAGSPNSSE